MWKQRRIKRRLVGFNIKYILTFFILVMFVLIIYFLKSGFFNIKVVEIEVKDIACVQTNQLKDSSNLSGQNFLFLDFAKVVSNLKNKFVCIKSIEVSKYLPDKVKLQVLGRQPLAVLISLKEKQASISALVENMATPSAEQVQNSLVVDDEGVIFAEDPNLLNTPKIYIYNFQTSAGEKVNNIQIKNILKILEKIKAVGLFVNSGFAGDDFFVVNIENLKPKIIFRLTDQVNIQLASLQLIISEAKINRGTIPDDTGIDLRDTEFIDLRFDKPVIKVAPKK